MENVVAEIINEMDRKTLVSCYSAFLDAIPCPALLVSARDKVVISANKAAVGMGVRVGGHCWREFMREEHLSERDEFLIKKYPGEVPEALHIQCTFCKADACMTHGTMQSESCMDAFGKKWDTYWIRCDKEVFLHYAVDVSQKFELEQLLQEERRKMRNIINGMEAGTWETNLKTGEQTVNEKWASLIGYTVPELSPATVDTWLNHIYFEDRELAKEKLNQLCNEESYNYNVEFRMVHKNGSLVWINSRGGISARTEGGEPLCISGIHIDITKRKEMELQLREKEEQYHTLFTMSADPLFLIDDATGRILEANAAACSHYGYKLEELLELKHLDISAEPAKTLDEMNNPSEKIPVRLHKKKSGVVFPVEINISYFIMKGRGVHISAVRDITMRLKTEKEITYLSYHDQLTGLFNRRFYEEVLHKMDTERNYPLTLLMGDVNGLKMVNDCFGHKAGDELLKKVAEILMKGCREDDIIARVGGDEFVIILPNSDAFETQKIVSRIQGLCLKETAGIYPVSVSFGYDIKTEKSQDLQEVFNQAEDYMYRHKLVDSDRLKSGMLEEVIKKQYENNEMENNHALRVSEISEKIATHMGLPKEDIDKIKLAALVHDIGKMGLEENILAGEDKLKTDEIKQIQKHPEMGYRLLKSTKRYEAIAEFVLEHHEKWDGSGYPKGLKGIAISLPARIISVAEAFDAMTEKRYRNRIMSRDAALRKLMAGAGTQFDPDIVEIFVVLFS